MATTVTHAPAAGRRPQIHFHTDHSWFAGCETMLVNLLSSREIRREFDVSLSYRHSDRYAAGLQQRMVLDFPVYPLRFRAPWELFASDGTSRAPLHRAGRAVSRQLTTVPLLVTEAAVLRGLLRRIRPAILHINNGGYPGALSARSAAIAGRLAAVPRVLMVLNNMAEDYTSMGRRLEFPVDRAVVASTDLFLAGSRASAERVREVLRLDEGRVAGVHNGADLRRPTESVAETRARLGLGAYRGVVFGIVGLLEPRKGHRVLLDAVTRLRDAGAAPEQIRLVILGSGPLRGELERIVAEQGLGGHCRFLDEEPNAMNVISALDVLVLPSVASEDFPNVILEAMAAGKPVIASCIAGTPEQVADGETGLLVPPGDAVALTAAMARMANRPVMRRTMGEAGRRRFRLCFTAEAAAGRYAVVYRALLGRQPTPAPDTSASGPELARA